MPRANDLKHVHPKWRPRFQAMADHLERHGFFPYETYRTDEAQRVAYEQGFSRALPGESPHGWGLATDFVPMNDHGGWYWPKTEDPIWTQVRSAANAFGLRNTLAWDRPHVEVPDWRSHQDPHWRKILQGTMV